MQDALGSVKDRQYEGRWAGWARWLGLIWLVAFAIFTVMPFVWMFTSSFKPSSVVFEMPPTLFPSEPTLNNFQRLFRYKDAVVLNWLKNSAIIALAVTFSNLLVASWAGYALAKMRFTGRRVIFWAILASMMIPRSGHADPRLHAGLSPELVGLVARLYFSGHRPTVRYLFDETVHADFAVQPHRCRPH